MDVVLPLLQGADGHLASRCISRPALLSCRRTVQRPSALRPCRPWSWPSRSHSWTTSFSGAFPTSECTSQQQGLLGDIVPRQTCMQRRGVLFYFILVFCLFRATPWHVEVPRQGSNYSAVVADLCHSHSNRGSEPKQRPTPQLMAALDP